MSNLVHHQEFEDEEEQFQSSTIVTQSSIGSPSICNPNGSAAADAVTTSKKKRNLPGNPDPDAEVVALSPRTLMATNRYICEVCHKGFQRDQNLQLHRRGHNLPWKLKQRPNIQVKKRVYVCPEPNCVHHNPSRALGDLTGIKKHYCRKHGEKKWKCDKCSKRYAVQSDWKAHAKICGTREYRCDCGTIFSRKDSFVTHRAFCDALSEENHRSNHNLAANNVPMLQTQPQEPFSSPMHCKNTALNGLMNMSTCVLGDQSLEPLSLNSNGLMIPSNLDPFHGARALNTNSKTINGALNNTSPLALASAYTSATALLQKAAEIGSKTSDNSITPVLLRGFTGYSSGLGMMNTSDPTLEMTPTSNNSVYMGNFETSERTIVHQMGLYNHSSFMHTSGENSSSELISMHEKMTFDFLGVEPPAGGHSGLSKRRRYEDHAVSEAGSTKLSFHDLHSEW